MQSKTKKLILAISCVALAAIVCVVLALTLGGNRNPDNEGQDESTHTHTYVWHDEVAATCKQNGVKGYYSCEGCGKFFDADKKEVTLEQLAIVGSHSFSNNVCTQCGLDLSGVISAIDALPESDYTFADILQINAAKLAYDALDNAAKDMITNAKKLENAVSSIDGIKIVADAGTIKSGGQCDQSLTGFNTTLNQVDGLGTVATVNYETWQWANYMFDVKEELPIGTKVAFGIYNASDKAVGFHWGNAATVYTAADLATLQPGWNLVTFDWEWDTNADGGVYLIASHLYALSPVGTGTNMNGWKFTGLFTYTDADVFEQIYTKSVEKSGEKVSQLSGAEGIVEAIDALPTGNYTLADVATIRSVKEAYDALSEGVKAKVTNVSKLEKALAAISDIRLVADAGSVVSGGQCDNSLKDYKATVSNVKGFGNVSTITYTAWQWANYKYNCPDKIPVGTKVAFGIYNASDKEVGFHWGNASTVYTEYNLVTLKPGWNLVTFNWNWDTNADGGEYQVASHLYALSKVGNGMDMNGWKFTGLFAYTDAKAFATVSANSLKLVDNTNSGVITGHEHSYAWNDEVKATCTVDGRKGCYTCAGCDKYFDSNKKETALKDLVIPHAHNFVNSECTGCGLNVDTIIQSIENLSLGNLEEVRNTYNALSAEDKALITNAAKLTAYDNITIISASGLKNVSENGSAITFTAGTDDAYGLFGKLDHTASWALVGYDSAYELQGKNVKLVFYVYNPSATDLDIAVAYPNDSQPQSIFKDACYAYAKLAAQSWTKVVVDWSAEAYDYYMNVGLLRILASTGSSCTAGNATNMTGFKISSMYVVNSETELSALEPADVNKGNFDPNAGPSADVQAVIDAINGLTLANLEANYTTVLNQYNALSDANKALVTNAGKLTDLAGWKVFSADSLTKGDGNGTVSSSAATDATYGKVGTLTHEGGWVSVKYGGYSDQLNGYTGKLVVYMYNPGSTDIDIAYGYINDSHDESIYKNSCYKYTTLTAGKWTKVVIDWSAYSTHDVQVQFINMLASTGSSCTAGSSTNLTGIKMSSMFMVSNDTALDALIPTTGTEDNSVETVISAINGLTLANLETNYTTVLNQYNALSDANKALVTNAGKLTDLAGWKLFSADSLTKGDGSGTVSSSAATDATYGKVGTLTHEGGWVSVKYGGYSDQLNGYTGKLVVYMYNPGSADIDIAYGYINDSHAESIYKNSCYKYATLTAGKWTKVVIDWSAYSTHDVQVQFINMLASTGGSCTAGSSTNLTGIKMSSMFMVNNDTALDALISTT